jgi:hypothetical protein
VSDLSLNGSAVQHGTLRLPRVGAWTADLVVDTDAAPTGSVALTSADGAHKLQGTVVRAGVDGERAHVLVVGGAGGLGREVAPVYYRGVPLRLPIGEVLRAAGETLSTTSDAAVLGRLLGKWTRERASAGTLLGHLLDAVGGVWRVADDGSVWVGEETWPTADAADVDLIADDPSHGRVTVGAASLPLGIRPGTVYNGQRVSYVEHTFDAEAARAEVWFEREGAASDRWGVALDALVRHTMREVLWHARFPARVVRQNADLTLDLDPDDDRLPDLVAVPLRLPVPGATVKVAAGCRVLVAFEAGDPRRPIAEVWESGTLNELVLAAATKIELGGAASKGVARQDDPIEVPITLTVANASGVGSVTIAWTDPTGVPQAISMSFTGAAQYNGTPAAPGIPLKFAGIIRAASAKVFAVD